MRFRQITAGALALGVLASPAFAQETGQYGAPLRRMIEETAAGTCPEAVMGDELLAACRRQLPQMSEGLSSLGAIQSITFVRAEDRPEVGRVEMYEVRFANGETLNWGIGAFKDGKFEIAYAGG